METMSETFKLPIYQNENDGHVYLMKSFRISERDELHIYELMTCPN